ncbi:MAG TPA: hypothetical protein VFQ45_19850 [Longimicrobium sp.]|nr:hypothetical protein [Longimicrobium sp.]
MMRPDIELHVDELVLEGVAARDRHAVGQAMRAELARLIAERGLPASLAAADGMARLDGARFSAAAGQGPAQIGAAVARSIFGAGGGG